MTIRIGTSGWSYEHWRGVLYPPESSKARWLSIYLQQFDTVELNASYYRWPRQRTFAGWQQRLPDWGTMSVKAPRHLTHFKRLFQPERWTQRMAADVAQLGHKVGVLLVQLSPTFGPDLPRLDYFLAGLPSWLRTTVEFRQPDWHHEETFALLQRYGAAYCVMSGAGLPCILRATAPFVYVRLHGPSPHHLYGGSYSDNDMGWWADRIREWQGQGRDVYAYFNNDGGGNAVRNALTLKRFLGV